MAIKQRLELMRQEVERLRQEKERIRMPASAALQEMCSFVQANEKSDRLLNSLPSENPYLHEGGPSRLRCITFCGGY